MDLHQHPLRSAILVGLLIAFLLVFCNGCATDTYTMKNCKVKDKPYWDCEKP